MSTMPTPSGRPDPNQGAVPGLYLYRDAPDLEMIELKSESGAWHHVMSNIDIDEAIRDEAWAHLTQLIWPLDPNERGDR